MPETQSYEIAYPSSRQLTFDVGKIGLAKHHVQALLEVDVTEAQRLIKQSRHSGRKISFTAWLIKSIADCVALHPPIAGLNDAKYNKVLVFNDVDISIVVEKNVNGTRAPLPYVIRTADKKTLYETQGEIEAAKSQTVKGEGDYVLGEEQSVLDWYASALSGVRLFERTGRNVQGGDPNGETLPLTLLIDHDVIDGVPAAKFVDDLVKKLQAGYG